MKKNFTRLAALMLSAVFVFSAPQAVVQASSNMGDDTLIVAVMNEPVSLDPIGRNDTATSQGIAHIYNTLVAQTMIDDEWTVIPSLAHSWEFTDSQTLVLDLVEGVTFHDGGAMTAEDVKFSLDRAINSVEFAFLYEMITEVEINNDHQVTLHLEYPFAPMLAHLAHTGGSIVSKAVVTEAEKGDGVYGVHPSIPIGTGPMKFVELVQGNRFALERFEEYWGEDKANVKELIFRIIPDPTMRRMALSTGEVHITDIQPADVPLVEADDNVQILRSMNFSINFIGMNSTNEYLSDPRVRQAINYAIDTDLIIEMVYRGVGQPTSGLIGDLVWGSTQSTTEPFSYDLDKALELMKEAGYEDGFPIQIWYNTPNVVRQEIAEILQFELRAINIDVTVTGMDWASYLDALDAMDQHEMYIMGWVTGVGDPDYGLYPLLHTSSFGATGNRTATSVPELDDLLDAGRQETDPEKRLEIYAEIQEMIRELAPFVYINQGETVHATRLNVRNYNLTPQGHQKYYEVYFADEE